MGRMTLAAKASRETAILLVLGSWPFQPLQAATFGKDIRPLLRQYCFKCHSGGNAAGNVDLTAFRDRTAVLHGRSVWVRVLERVSS